MSQAGWIDHPAPQLAETEDQAQDVDPEDSVPQDEPTTLPEAPAGTEYRLVTPVEGDTGMTGRVQTAAVQKSGHGRISGSQFP